MSLQTSLSEPSWCFGGLLSNALFMLSQSVNESATSNPGLLSVLSPLPPPICQIFYFMANQHFLIRPFSDGRPKAV